MPDPNSSRNQRMKPDPVLASTAANKNALNDHTGQPANVGKLQERTKQTYVHAGCWSRNSTGCCLRCHGYSGVAVSFALSCKCQQERSLLLLSNQHEKCLLVNAVNRFQYRQVSARLLLGLDDWKRASGESAGKWWLIHHVALMLFSWDEMCYSIKGCFVIMPCSHLKGGLLNGGKKWEPNIFLSHAKLHLQWLFYKIQSNCTKCRSLCRQILSLQSDISEEI